MDIGEILSSLSAEDMKMMQNIASSIMSNNQESQQTPGGQNNAQQETPPNQNANNSFDISALSSLFSQGTSQQKPLQNSPQGQNGGLDLNALGGIANLMGKLNQNDDKRCQLITALKPLLSPERQQRADEALRIIKLIDILPLIRDSGLLRGVF